MKAVIETCFDSFYNVEIARTCLRPDRELIADLLASWIVHDRPNSITLSSWLAGRRPARELARELLR